MANRILYNVTVNIDAEVHEEWLRWMQQVHIPDVMRTGLFTQNRMCRIHAYEEGGMSYSIQYICESMEHYERYQREFAAELQRQHTEKFGGRFAAFRTVLEIVHEQRNEETS